MNRDGARFTNSKPTATAARSRKPGPGATNSGARFTNSKPTATAARSRKPGPAATNSRAGFTNSKPAATAGKASQHQKRPPKKQKQAAATTSKATAAIPHRRMAVTESKAGPALDLRGSERDAAFPGDVFGIAD